MTFVVKLNFVLYILSEFCQLYSTMSDLSFGVENQEQDEVDEGRWIEQWTANNSACTQGSFDNIEPRAEGILKAS